MKTLLAVTSKCGQKSQISRLYVTLTRMPPTICKCNPSSRRIESARGAHWAYCPGLSYLRLTQFSVALSQTVELRIAVA